MTKKMAKIMANKLENIRTKVIVEVSCTDNNYCASLPFLPGCITTGDSMDEIEQNINEIVPFHLEGMRDSGEQTPEEFEGEYEFVYNFSVEALLNHYSGIFTKAALSRITGINERQLWHYAAGLRKTRKNQAERITNGLHKLGRELLSIGSY
jgi:predicted RNase H-like HicB family nuclease